MKRPSQELVDAFFAWYRGCQHTQNEDYYVGKITADVLGDLTQEKFIEFFTEFAREGGRVQSGGHRTAPMFQRTIQDGYETFRSFVLEPFGDEFDEFRWLDRTKEFPAFGQGLATIYLNRIDKKRFAIVNNKAVDALALLDVQVPVGRGERFRVIRDAEQQLIDWFPEFDNFYRADALAQFLIGEELGQPWADELRGKPRYWIYAPGERARMWEQYQSEGVMGVGWRELKRNLAEFRTEAALREVYDAQYGDDASDQSFRQLADFVLRMRVGDQVFVKRGTGEIVGFGEVASGYFFEHDRPEYRHLRKAKWLKIGNWPIPEGEKGLPVKTLTEVKESERIQSLLALIEGSPPPETPPPQENLQYPLDLVAKDVYLKRDDLERWVQAIQRKKQAIFYGPPGTGKTYLAQKLARHLIGGGDGFCELLQFHPSYAYEDFMQGLRPKALKDGGLEYAMVPGRFKEFCGRAAERKGPCVLVIDEINRANLARVFGELMYLLEYRNESVPLAGGERFHIPANAVIIGTMNTADRSIALVDHALRRRFAFLALYPNYDVLRAYHAVGGFNPEGLIGVLERLNAAIDDKHYSVGVSFFLDREINTSAEYIWETEIEPYIDELFFNEQEKAKNFEWERVRVEILGT